jgi:hypothetical protein
MHELSIAISMIDQITEESESRGGLDVEAVHLKLGPSPEWTKRRCSSPTSLPARARAGGIAAGDRDHSPGHLLRCVSERPGPRRRSISSVVRSVGARGRRSSPAARSKLHRWRLRHEHTHGGGQGQGPEAERSARPRSARAVSQGGYLRRRPGLKPWLGKDSLPGKAARGAWRATLV